MKLIEGIHFQDMAVQDKIPGTLVGRSITLQDHGDLVKFLIEIFGCVSYRVI